jgi:uncharacterized phage protein (TIGR01671 family)
MREIKFRAKRIRGDSQWRYLNFNEWAGDDSPQTHFAGYAMDIKTICQYTGLKDKNGKEIYEEDIVKFYIKKDVSIYKQIEIVGTVYYRGGVYRIEPILYYQRNHSIPIFQIDLLRTEVIGNVYENPEMMEGL